MDPKHLPTAAIISENICTGVRKTCNGQPLQQHQKQQTLSTKMSCWGGTEIRGKDDIFYWCLRCWVRLSLAFFSGRQTGQSCRVQFFQWEMICLDDAQWATAGKRAKTPTRFESCSWIRNGQYTSSCWALMSNTLFLLHFKWTQPSLMARCSSFFSPHPIINLMHFASETHFLLG